MSTHLNAPVIEQSFPAFFLFFVEMRKFDKFCHRKLARAGKRVPRLSVSICADFPPYICHIYNFLACLNVLDVFASRVYR